MSEALRILILEDRPADAELVTRELRKAGFEFVAKTVTTENEFLAELRDSAPQLILADYSLPGYDGLSALAAAQKQCPETPFIFVSGSLGEEKAIETLHRGATDYVLKQRLARLGPAVRRALREREERRKREQAEKERHESEEQMRAMFDLASIGIASADPRTGQWLRVNEKMCAIAGYSAAELLRMRIPELTHPDDRQKDWEAFQRVVRGETSDYRLEKRYVRKDGAVAWVNVNMTVIRDAAGQPMRTMATIEDITERKQLEEALRESSRFNQQIVASAQEGIIVYGRDLKYQVWNPFMEQLTGLPADQVLGKHPDELFPFLREAGVLASIEKALAGEPTSPIDLHVEARPTGKSGWTSQTDGPLRNAAGEIIGAIVIVQDITERKRAELRIAAFANLGQRLNAAKTAKEAGKIIVDVADELLGWDACLFNLCSAAENRLSHLLTMDLIDGRRTECKPQHPNPPLGEIARRAIEEGGQLILRDHPEAMRPENVPFGDTARPSASLMFVPIRHGTEVVGILSIQSYKPKAYDAHSLEALQALADYGGGALERLRIQEALGESEATFRSVWESSIDGMRLTDKEGRIIAVNEAFCQLVKLPREKLVGQVFSVAYKGHGLNDGIDVYQKRFATGDIVPRITARAQLWNSDEPDLDISNSFIELGQRGKVLLSIFRDVSERKALEVQLRQSQKMEAVGQLAGGVAHDFNNMLAVIRGNAELLLMDEGQHTSETRESLKHVVEASERAANLTRQLLTFSRKQVMQPQSLVLNEVIANLTKMLNRVISENIDLQCQYATPLPYVQADTGMMEQVILNLVVNARDAMPQGGQLRVATEQLTLDEAHARVNPEARAGEFVCLLVSDTGSGIAPEVLPRIFEPFFTTKEPGKGTGLGLATVYGIVQQHQGWIEVSSRVGEGSTFKVFLPAIPTPAGLAATAEAGADILGGKETILLVEDEHSVRMATRRVLESKGYTIREATSAREALELWQSHAGEIALLLTDIVMPGEMTGRDLAERLWGQRPGLNVIFMSGYSAEVLGKGTDFIRRTKSQFLQKPSTSRAILETVRRCLNEKESVAAPAEAGRAK